MNISEIMSTAPFAVASTASVRHAINIMNEGDIRHVPVIEDGALVGILSDRDMRSLLPTFLERFDAPQLAERILSQPVSSVMSTDVLAVCPEDDVGEAIDLLIENRVGALPVIELGSRKLLGIVSYVDALRAARDLLS
ncbi:MAG TPA: CBS domain-containing protein [Polyangiaceae bacterium]|nr:CBS domain-containing protein [Polyangiaceae bacterium]